jgi:hypothetical protein
MTTGSEIVRYSGKTGSDRPTVKTALLTLSRPKQSLPAQAVSVLDAMASSDILSKPLPLSFMLVYLSIVIF